MKASYLLNIVLAIALLYLSIITITGSSNTQEVIVDEVTDNRDSEYHDFDVNSDFDGNPFTWFKGAGLLLAAGDSTDFNEMTIGWGALGNIWDLGGKTNTTITVYVAKSRHTRKYMDNTKYFTVMKFDSKDNHILNYMGSHSGRDGDKVKALGLHTLFTENGTPYFAEATEVYECEKIYYAPLDPNGFSEWPIKYYETRDPQNYHSMYIGRIVKAIRR